MKDIRIDVGVYTVLNINLENADLTGIKEIVFTVKNFPSVKSEVIIERVFTEAKVHEIIIKPEESMRLTDSAVYDFNKVLVDGTRQKMTENGKVILRKGVGDCIDD